MIVTVYHIGSGCVQCNQTKRVMNQLGIAFDEVDLRQHPDIADKFKDEGHLTAPIVTADTETWSGFRLERIRGLARKLDLERAHLPFEHRGKSESE